MFRITFAYYVTKRGIFRTIKERIYSDINWVSYGAESVHRLLQTGIMAVFCAKMIGSLFVAILTILSQVRCDDSAELEAYYDGKSCNRKCDGNSRLCYQRFIAENYVTMGS